MLRAWAVLTVLGAAAPSPSVYHSSAALDYGPPDGCLARRRCSDDEPDPPRTAPVPAGAATADRSAWHELPVDRAWRVQRQAARAGSRGLRNEITALQESASPARLFTPLIWWQ